MNIDSAVRQVDPRKQNKPKKQEAKEGHELMKGFLVGKLIDDLLYDVDNCINAYECLNDDTKMIIAG